MAKTFMDQDIDAELEGLEDSDEEKAELNLLYNRLNKKRQRERKTIP